MGTCWTRFDYNSRSPSEYGRYSILFTVQLAYDSVVVNCSKQYKSCTRGQRGTLFTSSLSYFDVFYF